MDSLELLNEFEVCRMDKKKPNSIFHLMPTNSAIHNTQSNRTELNQMQDGFEEANFHHKRIKLIIVYNIYTKIVAINHHQKNTRNFIFFFRRFSKPFIYSFGRLLGSLA